MSKESAFPLDDLQSRFTENFGARSVAITDEQGVAFTRFVKSGQIDYAESSDLSKESSFLAGIIEDCRNIDSADVYEGVKAVYGFVGWLADLLEKSGEDVNS